jgi:hypothetical protein
LKVCALAPVNDYVDERADGDDDVKDTKLCRFERASNDSCQKDSQGCRYDLSYSKVRGIADQELGGI